ncbi:MAG: hypothetical protein K2N67_07495, partial [Mucispirillum sp.]|nr:hypothetical protein [Mucispirillum sp.]
NIFIFVDEAHRTQYGIASENMRAIMPRACIIGFTGTPLLSREKSKTLERFGGLIDSYKMKDAERDGAVLQIYYQGRFSEQHIDVRANKMYERITAAFTEKEKADFARKYISSTLLEETRQYVSMICIDIYDHFMDNFKGTGLKGQLVAPSKYAAVCFYKWFQENAEDLKTAVVISDDNKSDNKDDFEENNKKTVSNFLSSLKNEYGSLNRYETSIINEFKKNYDGVDILIVVDKLLTGFDAPRNSVLYLTKQLKDHSLMQAIARVNRVFDGDENSQQKSWGLIIDYSANASNLKSAMTLFNNFNPEDVEDILNDPDKLIQSLADIFNRLHGTFSSLKQKHNLNDYIEYLKSDENALARDTFYDNLNKCKTTFEM